MSDFSWDDEPAHSHAAAEVTTNAPDLLAGLRNGKWLDGQVFLPLTYAVPGVVPEGLSLLVGAPKIGKSWMVLDFALGVAHGGYALGCLPAGEARPVFYAALEDGDRRMQDRCRRLLDREPIPERLDYMTQVMPGNVVATLAAWLGMHGAERPLVILDTLGKVMPPALQGETTYSRDYRIGSTLKRLADDHPGACLLVNHHDRKAASEDFVDAVSGTNGLAGAADSVLVVSRARGETTGVLRVTGRDAPEGEYAVTFDDAVWTLDGEDLDAAARRAREARVTAGLGDRSAEVVAFVGKNPDGVRARDVEAALGDDARRYLARLVDAGRLRRASRGLYTPVPTVPLSQVDGERLGQRDGWDTVRRCRVCGFPLDPALGDVDAHGHCEEDPCSPR
ncbi:MAG: AAA family ATPase [Streptosporangiales bacterium]|nr:AAA family ATPase [Streptosporangiales bacterium]